MPALARLFRWFPASASVTVCESCGQACTSSCRAIARVDRDRTAALAGGVPR